MSLTFVAADWSALESWLTAFFARDRTLEGVLRASLDGGPKVHAINAALIYGCEPADAKKHVITLQGQERAAYDGGKRLTHAWSYGMRPYKMAETFWISRREAMRIDGVLSQQYSGVAEYRERLGEELWGVAWWDCTVHGVGRGNACCRTARWAGWATPPEGVLYTPFGRRRFYLGRLGEGLNAACAQRPQSAGADMWYTTLGRLHGEDWPAGEWPVLPGAARTHAYALYAQSLVRVVTGTYDSFVVQVPTALVADAQRWLLWTMEQPWHELGGWRFPAEVSVGTNWGKWHETRNPAGLRDVAYKPLSAVWP